MIFPTLQNPVLKISFIVFLLCRNTPPLSAQTVVHSNELGIHFGNFVIDGDVDHPLFPGWGLGLHYRTSLNQVFSFRTTFSYGITHGLNANPTGDGILNEPEVFRDYSIDQPWFYAFQSRLIRLNVQGIMEITNLGYSKKYKDFNLYALAGIGLNSHGTWLDLYDTDGLPYRDLLSKTSYQNQNEFNTAAGRRAIRKLLTAIYDKDYETPAPKEAGIFRLGDETNISFEGSIGAGVSYRATPKFNISLEHEMVFSKNDYLDGLYWRTQSDISKGNDIIHYTNLRIGINFNVKTKREPMYWVNPWEEHQTLLDSLEKRISLLEKGLLDSDADGVADAFDQQPNSASNCPVDVKGVTLDSDRDGIADCYDKFPFGDKADIEEVVDDYLSTKEKYNIDKNKPSAIMDSTKILEEFNKLFSGNTLFPLVLFESNESTLNTEGYTSLAHIASFLHHSNIGCLEVIGHTDSRDDTIFNEELGMERAVAVIRVLQNQFLLKNIKFIPITLGESAPLIMGIQSEVVNRINRRVELKACKD